MAKIKEKSGAPADMMEFYKEDGSQSLDIFSDRWDLAEHMSFFIPACARTAKTVSIRNSNSTTNIQEPKEAIPFDANSFEELELVFDVSMLSNFIC